MFFFHSFKPNKKNEKKNKDFSVCMLVSKKLTNAGHTCMTV